MKILKTAAYKKFAEYVTVSYAEDIGMASQWENILKQDNIPAIVGQQTSQGIGVMVPEDYIDEALLIVQNSSSDLNHNSEYDMGDINETKPATMTRNIERPKWDAEGDFSDKLRDEFSGYNSKKEDDAMNDKWNQLFSKDKKKQPSFAKEDNMKILKTASYLKLEKKADLVQDVLKEIEDKKRGSRDSFNSEQLEPVQLKPIGQTPDNRYKIVTFAPHIQAAENWKQHLREYNIDASISNNNYDQGIGILASPEQAEIAEKIIEQFVRDEIDAREAPVEDREPSTEEQWTLQANKKIANEKLANDEELDNKDLCSCRNCGHSFLADKRYEQSCPQCDSPRVSCS